MNSDKKIKELNKKIDSMKGIIKLKDAEISKLKQQLLEKEQQQEKQETLFNDKSLGQNYLDSKQISDSLIEEQDILENKQLINYNQEVNENKQSKNFNFSKETIIFENEQLIVERLSFLEGQYSEKYHCACQKVFIVSKNPEKKIESIKFELPKDNIEKQGFLIQVEPYHTFQTQEWEFEILYTICIDIKNINPLTTMWFSFIVEYEEGSIEEYYNFPVQLSLLDFCEFKQIQNTTQTLNKTEENENILEMQKRIVYSQLNEEKQQLFGQFQLHFFPGIFPLFFYNIQFEDDLLNEINVEYSNDDFQESSKKNDLSIANIQIKELFKYCLTMEN